MKYRVQSLALLAAFGAAAAPALADTGVSEERVSLPEGPGSLEGVGENVGVGTNMGLMSHQVSIALPAGFAGLQPDLSLSYSSGNGSSVVGMGWRMEPPSIERMTHRGLPSYDAGDLMAANMSDELVAVPGSSPPQFRARFEGGFVRYTWVDAGAAGYWVAEFPNGSTGYFGARPSAAPAVGQAFSAELEPSARVSDVDARGRERTFRYNLTTQFDVHGHRMDYFYKSSGGHSLLTRVAYVQQGGAARYAAELSYERRQDLISDAGPGFETVLQERLTGISVQVAGRQLRRYALSYEDYDLAGGFSRLARVNSFGANDELYEVVHSFDYSQSLGGLCSGGCEEPFLVSMGSLGVGLRTGSATLIDINGDALPDVVDTSSGEHRFFQNTLAASGAHGFAPATQSEVGTSTNHLLSQPHVQTLDVNADGFSDVVNLQTGKVLQNLGAGDWSPGEDLDVEGFPLLGNDGRFRFVDVDNDKRIDLLFSDGSTTEVYANQGGGRFERREVPSLGLSFGSERVHLADMNGDGLLDIARVLSSGVEVRLSVGNGEFLPKQSLETAFDAESMARANLEDLNGDGVADVVVVDESQVRFSVNRAGRAFDAPRTLSQATGGSLPGLTDNTLLFADMNGNGSNDIVWVTPSGEVTYLEIFPVRPNLLTTVRNGLGAVTEVRYGTSVSHMARDREAGRAWSHKLPHPMVVVNSVDTYDELTEVHEVSSYEYSEGFYDSEEKRFRGYGEVRTFAEGNETQDPAVLTERFLLGDEPSLPGGYEPAFAGKLASSSLEAQPSGAQPSGAQPSGAQPSGALVALSQTRSEWGLCELRDVPERVRFVCQQATEQLSQEGQEPAQWVTTTQQMAYDGYGNVTESRNLGVTAIGGAGCAPCAEEGAFGAACGAQCLGDEHYVESRYVEPLVQTAGRWIVGYPSAQVAFGSPESREAGEFTESRTYYDGQAFVGLAEGLTLGNVSRTTERLDESGATIDTQRSAYDRHGNATAVLGALADPQAPTGHRRLSQYSEDGLRVTQVDLPLQDERGAYSLRQSYTYDPLFDLPTETTGWMLFEANRSASDPKRTLTSYDGFGRVAKIARPGRDTLETPTERYEYELGAPVTRVRVLKSSRARSRTPDLEEIHCLDGRGRRVQSRVRIEPGLYQTTGFLIRNLRGSEVRNYEPYQSASAACDRVPPAEANFVAKGYDGAGRWTRTTLPDGSLHGGVNSVTRTLFEPLAEVTFDQHGVGTRNRSDGLGRPVAIERDLGVVHLSLSYDSLGRLTRWVDEAGNTKRQAYDLLGRAVEVQDPNAGLVTQAFDDGGNLVRRTNGAGQTTLRVYDGASRLVEEWDASDRDATLATLAYDRRAHCEDRFCSHPEGRLVRSTYPLPSGEGGLVFGSDERGYDVRGAAVALSRDLGLGSRFHVRTLRDNLSRLSQRRYDEPRLALVYRYDGLSRVTEVRQQRDVLLTHGYDERGLLASTTFGNGLSERRAYDSLLRLSDLAVGESSEMLEGVPAEPSRLGFHYERSRLGDLTAIEDRAFAQPMGHSGFRYDPWRRLIGAEVGQSTEGEERLVYTLDRVDNLLSKNSSVGEISAGHSGEHLYSPERPHAVAQAGGLRLEYDAAGRMSGRGETGLVWDHLGRLTEAHREGTTLATFGYAFHEARAIKREGNHTTHYIDENLELRDGVAVLYARRGRQRIARLEVPTTQRLVLADLAPVTAEGAPAVDGRITAGDAWVATLRASGALAAEGAGAADSAEAAASASRSPAPAAGRYLAAAAQRLLLAPASAAAAPPAANAPVTHYLHADHLGSLVLATDAAGEVTGSRAYAPYGALLRTAGYVDSRGFTGQEADDSTGLTHFRFRYLDTRLGRWATPDPLFLVSGSGLGSRLGESTTSYAYVAGNAVNAIDATGLVGLLLTRERVIVMDPVEANGAEFGLKNSQSPIGKALRKFATTNYFLESLNFFDALADGTSPFVIYNRFLVQNAPEEVNVGSDLRQQARTLLGGAGQKHVEPQAWQQLRAAASRSILRLVMADPGGRFVLTDGFQTALKAHNRAYLRRNPIRGIRQLRRARRAAKRAARAANRPQRGRQAATRGRMPSL